MLCQSPRVRPANCVPALTPSVALASARKLRRRMPNGSRGRRRRERLRRARLNAIAQRGEDVWREIETEIMRRNALSYDRAVGLLVDLRAIADERDTVDDFTR